MTSGDAVSRTDDLLAGLPRTPLFRSLVPLEAGVGWPIAKTRQRGDRRVVHLLVPLFGRQPSPEKGVVAVLYPPFATVRLDWKTGRVVEYRNLQAMGDWPIDTWDEPAGTFPHEAARVPKREYVERRKALLRAYDELFESLSTGAPVLDEAWVRSFSALLGHLMEPSLLPYYRDLGPRFFAKFLDADQPEGTHS